MKYIDMLPTEGKHILFVLFLSFLIGLEREERRSRDDHYSFGGVRTFPLIGLIGYVIALLSGSELLPQALGFGIVAGFLLISYWHKISSSEHSSVASEMSGLTTYLVGSLVFHELYWIATTLTVISILLLELKSWLEALAKRIEPNAILTFAKFLMLSAVILPLLPNEPFSQFQINPFKAWLVVVAVSGVSYGSYLLQQNTRGKGGIILSALLGGAYSSTVTTVALARRSRAADNSFLFAGSILIASGMMYLRLAILLAIFNLQLMERLSPAFAVLACLGMGGGYWWARHSHTSARTDSPLTAPGNPLEISAALFFAVLLVVMLVATQLATRYLGQAGVFSLAALMGVADVDPFIMGLTQAAPALAPVQMAATAIAIAAASNNLVKGLYAFFLAPGKTGIQSLLLLSALALLGLIPLLFL